MYNNLAYDGSFDGLLTSIFTVFEQKLLDVNISKSEFIQNSIFAEVSTIYADKEKANRVWSGLKSKLSGKGKSTLYYAFLSETKGVENLILDYVQYVFASKQNVETDFSNPSVLKLSKLAKSVGREKHRMEAFVRFRLTKDNYYFASIDPDFNVLPLIEKHFRLRYADQKWVIYDIKRKYGIEYNMQKTSFVNFEFLDNFDFTKTDSNIFSESESDFQTLWKNYFDSTNIKSRKNMKLHIQHVPKRYWKYLSEKNPLL